MTSIEIELRAQFMAIRSFMSEFLTDVGKAIDGTDPHEESYILMDRLFDVFEKYSDRIEKLK